MSVGAVLPWLVDALVGAGLIVMTLGVVGVYRMPDTYAKLHAQSKTAAFGAIALVLAAVLAGRPPASLRGLLIVVFLLLTAPVAAHAIARAAWRSGERMRGGGDGGDPERDSA